MPKRADIKKILLIGSGPIIIGQACEFDYSGTQACHALTEEGYDVVLVNSNPATIMTDPDTAGAVYIEPLNAATLELIIKRERPNALLPTMGGQTALNLTVDLANLGILDRYGVELIGANLKAINKAEDRRLFKEAMKNIGLNVPTSGIVVSFEEGLNVIRDVKFPAILRPAFTLGGTGGGVAYNMEEYEDLLKKALSLSPKHQVLVEQSVIGWKEYELEVMRDHADNVVIICSIENFDPMGVHTGDSITVAPAQTLTDKEYQLMRDAAIAIIREIGVDTGGSNIQFAINPKDGQMMVIEMNPRVSRSSALASKATGFPIAKIAAKLAVGLRLDEIQNDITKETPASFEPTIDYVVTKIPRFTFEKFPEAQTTLTTQMKSVGEVMAIGRTFKESLQKAIRSLENDTYGFEKANTKVDNKLTIASRLKTPNSERLWYVADALRQGMTVERLYEITNIDPWFLNNILDIVKMELEELITIEILPLDSIDTKLKFNDEYAGQALVRRAKEYGFSDRRLAYLFSVTEKMVRDYRRLHAITPVYKMVDTCAAEFRAVTPYLYSTYERPFYRLTDDGQTQPSAQCEANPTRQKKVVILGSGPNRIGQGIEFDYCCVHAVYALKELGYETIMVNCNPETVSTDYDTSDRLYFEPLTIENVLAIIELERPEGVIVQFGGQTPLKLAVPLECEGVRILGTSPDAIDRAEDRRRFSELIHKLGLRQPRSRTAMTVAEARVAAAQIGYPIIVRPSYVLGGRAMEIVYDEDSLVAYMERAVKVSPEHPVLIDMFLEDAIEVDVDAISDGKDVVIGGVMQHIEEAGIHSGDSACSLPPYSLSDATVAEIKQQTKAIALELGVVGLMNIQFAVKDNQERPGAVKNEVWILEVNPRASRTIPYVSKATGVPLAKMAAKVMAGKTIRELGIDRERVLRHVAVKESVFPFDRFSGVDILLGPEMKSTGEVMGIDSDFGLAYAKAQASSYNSIPIAGSPGKIFISVRDRDKVPILEIARALKANGFSLIATRGTAAYLSSDGLEVEVINKVIEGRPHIVDSIKNKEISYIINTVSGTQAKADSHSIRTAALQYKVPYSTTVAGARALVNAIEMLKSKESGIKTIQDYHRSIQVG
ncbi:MAG: carbamoyl-phosphate synthase large subunit [Nitrospirae bacterium]|uniref:carbamoyl-phosphate synthase large subunit n=1 Tax=Candidatus Magnetobacterium casense TaxID=1455061 RepID=UPI00058C4939|nr:carbamoyl-phosphate synthase large subunit [Candidatus Magnetobacterium casensis]MBF0336583.1 carbamoyl-phosphate synthase large subunit [Nitrospirota bacterium]